MVGVDYGLDECDYMGFKFFLCINDIWWFGFSLFEKVELFYVIIFFFLLIIFEVRFGVSIFCFSMDIIWDLMDGCIFMLM